MRPQKNKIIIAIYLFCMLATTLAFGANKVSEIKFIAEFEGGKLYKIDRLNVVVLNGDSYQMGRQYGALLKNVLNDNYRGIIQGLKHTPNFSLKDLQKMGDVIYKNYPKKYQNIIKGLAETSGLGLKKAKLLNVQEMYINAAASALMKKQNADGHCSGIAAWGDYTANGPLVFGRNYDLGPVNAKYLMVTVYNHTDGGLPTASITYAGAICLTSGINREGLFVELNDASMSYANNFMKSRSVAPISLLNILELSNGIAEFNNLISSMHPERAYIINVADKDQAYSYELSTFAVKRRNQEQKGLLVATNNFFDSAWKMSLPTPATDLSFSVKRHTNLLALGEKYKGKFDPEVMMKVISTPIGKGGAFRTPNLTSYQIIAEPANRKIWIRIPEYQDWVEVDLARYFAS